MTLTEYINLYHNGNKAAFARSMNTLSQTVTKWVNGGYIVVNDELYSPRRKILNEESKCTAINERMKKIGV